MAAGGAGATANANHRLAFDYCALRKSGDGCEGKAVKRPRVQPQGKGQRGERAELPQKATLAGLLILIDAAVDDDETNRIIGELSIGARAMLYSALLYTRPAPGSAEQQPTNRSYALHILREFLLRGRMTDRTNNTATAEAASRTVTESAPDDASETETTASKSRPVETTERALDEYRAKQDAQRAKMARLTALRLKAEAKSGMKPKKR